MTRTRALAYPTLALAACTTITEIREIDCETVTAYDDNVPTLDLAVADSMVYTDCDRPEWEGLVVRFTP